MLAYVDIGAATDDQEKQLHCPEFFKVAAVAKVEAQSSQDMRGSKGGIGKIDHSFFLRIDCSENMQPFQWGGGQSASERLPGLPTDR